MNTANLFLHCFSSPSVQFSLCSRNAGKMDAPLRPEFSTCVEGKSQYFVMVLWRHYHNNATTSKVVCEEDCKGEALCKLVLNLKYGLPNNSILHVAP